MRTLWQILDEKFGSDKAGAHALSTIRKEIELMYLGTDLVISLADTAIAKKIIEKQPFRNQIVLTCDKNNAAGIYIGMTLNTRSDRYFVYLDPGDFLVIDNYRGELYALPVSANDKLAFGEW